MMDNSSHNKFKPTSILRKSSSCGGGSSNVRFKDDDDGLVETYEIPQIRKTSKNVLFYSKKDIKGFRADERERKNEEMKQQLEMLLKEADNISQMLTVTSR